MKPYLTLLAPITLLLVVLLLSNYATPIVYAQPIGWTELVEERTKTGKSFFDPSNRLTLVETSVSKIHYNGPDWKDVDNTLIPSISNIPTLGIVDLEMTTDDYEFYSIKTLNTIPLWFYRNKSLPESYVTFNPQALGWTNDRNDVELISMPVIGTNGIVTSNRLHWENAYGPGTNLTLSAQPGKLSKVLTLSSIPTSPSQFIIDGGNPSLSLGFIFGVPSGPNSPEIIVDGILWDQSSRVESVNAVEFGVGGKFLFSFSAPSVSDSGFNTIAATFILTKQGPNLRVSIQIPLGFLDTATYPVFIDPTTVDEQVGASVDDGYSLVGFFDFAGVNIFSGRDAGGSAYDAFARLTAVNIPVGVTVTSANISVYATSSVNDGPDVFTNIFLNDADDAVAPTTRGEHVALARTTNFVAWDEEDFVVDIETWSPDFSSAAQEVLSRGGWSANNDMMILWDDDNTLINNKIYRIYSWDNDNAKALQLHIVYESWENTDPTITNKITTDEVFIDDMYARSFSATDPDTNQTLQWELNATDAPFTITVWNGGNRTTWVNATLDTLGVFFVNVTVGDDSTTGNSTDFVNYTLIVSDALVPIPTTVVERALFFMVGFIPFLLSIGVGFWKEQGALVIIGGIIGIVFGLWVIVAIYFVFGFMFVGLGILFSYIGWVNIEVMT